MGDNKVDPKALKKTQDTLGKIIKKPPLTDKLLAKPPFRFLHDICTSVIKNGGFMKGLFTEAEMSSENVKDKESKTAFLQKAIDLVSLVLGRPLAAKPSKIVAGHEPDKTNEFLQALAEAVGKKVDNDDYVRRVLTGDTSEKAPEKVEKKEKPKEKERERSADRRKKPPTTQSTSAAPASKKGTHGKRREDKPKDEKDRGEKDRRHRDRKEREGSRDRREKGGGSRDRDEGTKEDRHRDREDRHKDREERHKDREDRHNKERENRHKDREDRHKDRDRKKRRDDEDRENKEDGQMNGEVDAENSTTGGGGPVRIPRPSSAKGSRRRQIQGRRRPEADDNEESAEDSPQLNGHLGEDDVPPQVAASRKMARPSSARPAPPRVKKNEPLPEEAVIVGSGNVPNIITDKTGASSDEDEDMFVTKEEEDAPPQQETETRPPREDGEEEDGDHGGLVKRIMETKAQLEHGSQSKEAQAVKKTEIDRSSQVTDVQRRKERELAKREIEKVRGSIQSLTRSVNPLGKILDFVQEDMDSMQKELDVWKKENKENQVALQREQSITDSSIEPLRAQLTELDNAIRDQLDLIAAVKSNILKNDDKISKMLGSVTKS